MICVLQAPEKSDPCTLDNEAPEQATTVVSSPEQNGSNGTAFTGSDSSATWTYTMSIADNCTPTSGVLTENQPGSATQTYDIQGYQGALAALKSSGNDSNSYIPVCNTSPPSKTGSGTITVNVTLTFNVSSTTANGSTCNITNGAQGCSVGPLTLLLEQDGKTIEKTTTNTANPPLQSPTDLTASFTGTNGAGVANGTYQVCSNDFTATPPCTTVTVASGPVTTSMSGAPKPGNFSLVANPVSAGGPTCETAGATLSWITCPIIDGIIKAVNGINHYVIQPMLKLPLITLTNNTSGESQAYQVWSNFRIYGNVVLVIALLVLVFGEVVGGGVIDAYTAKKMLPRILIGAILINLSIYIVRL